MALAVKNILDMDVAALKAACDEAGLAVRDGLKPTLQEALLSHHHPPADPINLTINQQAPAAQDLQSFFRLKPATLTVLRDSGYDSIEDVALLAQDPTFPANLDFIPVQRDRLALLAHIKKTADTSILVVRPSTPLPSNKPSRPKPIEIVDLEADDVRNAIVEIRKEKLLSSASQDARDIIDNGRQRRQDKRSRGREGRDSSESSTGSSTDRSSSRSRNHSRHRKHSRRSGESYDRVRSRSSHRNRYLLSKYAYDLPRPHHVVKPDALKGKDKKAKPEDLSAMEYIYGNIDTAHRLSKKVEGKHTTALQEVLEYTSYQARNFQSYKEDAVLLFDDEFRQQAKRDHLSLSDQSARDRLSHFYLNPQSARRVSSLAPSRIGSSFARYSPSISNPSTQVCWKYNNDRCTRSNCSYTHACSSCGDTKHKAYNCPKSTCSAGGVSGQK